MDGKVNALYLQAGLLLVLRCQVLWQGMAQCPVYALLRQSARLIEQEVDGDALERTELRPGFA